MGLFTMPSQAEKARHCCVDTLETDGIFQQCSQRGILQLHERLLWPLQQPTRASLLDSAAHPTACCAGFMMLCHIHLLGEVSTLSADCICPAKCAINPLCLEALVVQQQPFVMRHMCMQWAVAKRGTLPAGTVHCIRTQDPVCQMARRRCVGSACPVSSFLGAGCPFCSSVTLLCTLV